MNQIFETIKNRVSLRHYDKRDISENDLRIILESAVLAPTAGNMSLYSIIKVTDQGLKNKLALSCDDQPFIAKAPVILIFVLDWNKWYNYYGISKVEEWCNNNDGIKNFPKEGEFMLGASDALIAAQNAVIAAESLGIGSCYIGDIMEKYEYHKELLKLPNLVFPVAMLTLGYYPENFKRVHRKRFEEKYIVFENEYKNLNEEELSLMFADREYPSHNKAKAENFGQWMYSRKSGTPFIKEMSRSIAEALKQWKNKNDFEINNK